MHAIAVFVHPMETSVRRGVAAGYMVTVVGKLLARAQARSLSDDLVSFNDQARAVGVNDDPFPAEQRHCPIRRVLDGDKVDKSVRLVLRKTGPAVMVTQLVQ